MINELLEYAWENEGLDVEGVWRLSGEVANDLREKYGDGDWRGVAALAAGAGYFKASREGFSPLVKQTDDNAETIRRKLGEAFTKRLVPPTTAAGLFILLGVHPAWGVHLSHKCNRAAAGREPGARPDRELFPDETLEEVAKAVFTTLGMIVARTPECGHADELADVVKDAVHHGREVAGGGAGRGLPPFVDAPTVEDDQSNWRVIDFTKGDLLDQWLVPAGLATRHDDNTIEVLSEVRGLEVGV